jgi:hypothetical protein
LIQFSTMNENQRDAAASASSGNISSVKLPPFWSNSPAAWFRTVEAQFVVKNITDETDKYYLVVASLSEQQAELISSVTDEEPGPGSYANIKAAW